MLILSLRYKSIVIFAIFESSDQDLLTLNHYLVEFIRSLLNQFPTIIFIFAFIFLLNFSNFFALTFNHAYFEETSFDPFL